MLISHSKNVLLLQCSKIETVTKSFDSRNNGKVDFYCQIFLGNLYIIFKDNSNVAIQTFQENFTEYFCALSCSLLRIKKTSDFRSVYY